jgi:hypothetical protein
MSNLTSKILSSLLVAGTVLGAAACSKKNAATTPAPAADAPKADAPKTDAPATPAADPVAPAAEPAK